MCALLIINCFNNYGQIYISGNINNSSSAIFTSGTSTTISFCGATSQEINNSATLTFYDAIIYNSAGVTLLSGNINIDGSLTLTNGIFTTIGSSTIDLGSLGSIAETAINPSSYVIGNVKATRDIGTTIGNQTFGGIGLEINETTASSNSTIVTRTTGTSCTNGTNLGIKRYYDISPTPNSGLNATIKFYYFNHELDVINAGSSIVENNMIFYKSIDGGSKWFGQLPTNKVIADNWYEKTGISSFSRWTLADMGKPLPIELLSFSSFCENNNIGLKWATASETNNDYFTVERSSDALNFIPIGTIDGNGNNNTLLNYQFSEQQNEINCNPETLFYYRLKQTDYDGKYSYSDIISAQCCKNFMMPTLSPNPSDGNITGYVYNDVREINVTIINSLGQKVLSEKYLLNNTNTFLINAKGIENGIYIINLNLDSKVYTYRQIILKNK